MQYFSAQHNNCKTGDTEQTCDTGMYQTRFILTHFHVSQSLQGPELKKYVWNQQVDKLTKRVVILKYEIVKLFMFFSLANHLITQKPIGDANGDYWQKWPKLSFLDHHPPLLLIVVVILQLNNGIFVLNILLLGWSFEKLFRPHAVRVQLDDNNEQSEVETMFRSGNQLHSPTVQDANF